MTFTLTLYIWKKFSLTLCVLKGNTLSPCYKDRYHSTHHPDELLQTKTAYRKRSKQNTERE